MRALFVALSLSLALGGCGPAAPPTDEPGPVLGRVENAGFVLEVGLPRRQYSTGDAIPVGTTLTWIGAAPMGKLWGSGSGPVTFSLKEVGGARREMGGAMTADCTVTEFARGVPTAVPLRKSGGFDGADPNADFYRSWYADPAFRLPAGLWQLQVNASGMLAPCAAAAPTFQAAIGPIELEIR